MLRTKVIVITGYILLIALSIIGIAWIYSEWLNYTKGGIPYRQHRKELTLLSNTLAAMYHAESTVGLLALVTDSQLSQKYDSLTTASFARIERLRETSQDPGLNMQLDSLHLLLSRKKANTTELILLAQSFEADTLKQITRTTVLSQHDVSNLDKLLNHTFEQFQDTNLIVGKKKNVFRRIGEAIKSANPDTLREISSYSTFTKREAILPLLKDTLIELMRDINQASQRRNTALTARLLTKQNELYVINERTTAQINRIMKDLETSEYNDDLKRSLELSETIRRSSVVTSVIAIASILVAVFFMSWILRSLTINQRLHQQIKVAKKHLEELLAARERLILTITHDIKAPVSSILGYLELMTKDTSSSQERYYIDNMQQSAAHILDLVRHLLEYNSLSVNEHKPDRLPFSPAILLSDIYKSFIPNAQKKEQSFDFHSGIDAEALYVSDPYRIRQIVNNIVANAIKYTPAKGAIALSACLLQEDSESAQLLISVQDTGPGIREADRQRIFEAFQRLEYTGAEIEGLGLGLNISLRLAERLGGAITVDSGPAGEGSVFTLRLPLTPFYPTVGEEPVRILFIDDDPIQLDLVFRMTEREGMQPHICSHSLDALQVLQEKPFDIIFSDIQMPDIDGFELARRIRSAGFAGATTIPIIGLSAHSHVSQERYAAAGFSGFLFKPFTSDQLIQIILYHTHRTEKEATPCLARPQPAQGFARLIEPAGDDKAAAKAILHTFIADNKQNCRRLEQAFADDDWATVRQIAHKMTAVMKMISAEPLLALLEQYNAGRPDKENRALCIRLIRKTLREAAQFIANI
jgi:signal transduction histidine kinase/DNA-binding response OmpR family regulator